MKTGQSRENKPLVLFIGSRVYHYFLLTRTAESVTAFLDPESGKPVQRASRFPKYSWFYSKYLNLTLSLLAGLLYKRSSLLFFRHPLRS